jgi:hypothetical protein
MAWQKKETQQSLITPIELAVEMGFAAPTLPLLASISCFGSVIRSVITSFWIRPSDFQVPGSYH